MGSHAARHHESEAESSGRSATTEPESIQRWSIPRACAMSIGLLASRPKVDSQKSQVAEGAAPAVAVEVPAAPTGVALFFAAFFAAAFGAVFLADGFFFPASGAAVLGAAFFAAAAAFFAMGFDPFLAADFFFATGALTAASGAWTPLLSIRNASRFLAPAIHAGARPTPDQVLPVLGSAYLATPPLVRFGFIFLATLRVLPAAVD